MVAAPSAAHGLELYCLDMSVPSANQTAYLAADLRPGPSSAITAAPYYHYPTVVGSHHVCITFVRGSGPLGRVTEMGCYDVRSGSLVISDRKYTDGEADRRGSTGTHVVFVCDHPIKKLCSMDVATGNTTNMVVENAANVGYSDRPEEVIIVGEVVLASYSTYPATEPRLSVWLPSNGTASRNIGQSIGLEREAALSQQNTILDGTRVISLLHSFDSDPNRVVVFNCTNPEQVTIEQIPGPWDSASGTTWVELVALPGAGVDGLSAAAMASE